jgi:hypothetical protein
MRVGTATARARAVVMAVWGWREGKASGRVRVLARASRALESQF